MCWAHLGPQSGTLFCIGSQGGEHLPCTGAAYSHPPAVPAGCASWWPGVRGEDCRWRAAFCGLWRRGTRVLGVGRLWSQEDDRLGLRRSHSFPAYAWRRWVTLSKNCLECKAGLLTKGRGVLQTRGGMTPLVDASKFEGNDLTQSVMHNS